MNVIIQSIASVRTEGGGVIYIIRYLLFSADEVQVLKQFNDSDHFHEALTFIYFSPQTKRKILRWSLKRSLWKIYSHDYSSKM